MSTRLKDLTGMKFGKWTVIQKDKVANGAWKWICKCDCGFESSVFGCSLKEGSSKQCSTCSKTNRVIARDISKNINTLTLKQLSQVVQGKINAKMHNFTTHNDKLKYLYKEIQEIEKVMYLIVEELEPVESLIYTQNPAVERIFESLKSLYGKGSNGIDREAH